MRPVVGALVALALLTACSGKAAPSGVEGMLRQVGGPAPGFDWPTAGTVTVYPDTGEGDGWLIVELPGIEPVAKLGVDATGEFHLDLPSGAYLLTAVLVGGFPCGAQRVEVEVGQYTEVTVTCPAE